MSITVSTKAYNQDRIQADAIAYTGPANTITSQDIIELKRVYPKPTKDFRGVARPTMKISRTVTLDDDVTKATAILTVSGSLPVGIKSADLAALIADGVDLLQLEEAGTTKVFAGLDITY